MNNTNYTNVSITCSPQHSMEIIPLEISNNDKNNKVISFFPKGRSVINRPNIIDKLPLSIKYRLERLKQLIGAFQCNMLLTINPYAAYIEAKWFVDNYLEYVEGIKLYENETITIDYCLAVNDPDEQIDNLFVVPSQKTLRELFFDNSPTFKDEIIRSEKSNGNKFYFMCVFKAFEVD